MEERRFFSTLDKNIALSFTVNGMEMGSVVEEGSYNCLIEAADGNSAIFTQIQLFRNGEVFQTWHPDQSSPVITQALSTINGEYCYVKITQPDGDEAISLPISIVEGGNPDTDSLASGEITSRGVVSGNYLDTYGSDDVYVTITEEPKARRWTMLDHTWTFDIPGGASVIFHAEAHHSASSEGDNFVFAYSTDQHSKIKLTRFP
jgi:hypothetical protein